MHFECDCGSVLVLAYMVEIICLATVDAGMAITGAFFLPVFGWWSAAMSFLAAVVVEF